MIGSLRGQLAEKQPNRLVVDVQGVGYELQVPLSTFYGLGEVGADVSLRVHTHVREDALALFGFATRLELDLFERLISISGVGPRLALAVLSGIEPPELIRAVRAGDVARLTKIPGVGKKTAERIGLELKDRLPAGLDIATDAEDVDQTNGELRDDVLSALLNLGYHRPLAERAVGAALKSRAGSEGFEHALRQALRELAK
jgi:Holliday junction DNA helicase RuvA